MMEQKQCDYKKDRLTDMKESLVYRNHRDFTSQILSFPPILGNGTAFD